MHFFDYVFIAVEIPVLIYLAFISAYGFFLSIAGLFKVKLRKGGENPHNQIAIFVPAYKEDLVIYNSATQIIQQKYPRDKFDVYVIADSLLPDTIAKLKGLSINVIEVHFESSTKVKALNEGLKTASDTYDISVVMDADNIPAADFLAKINQHFNAGYQALQGQRKPKNTDTKMALLDGLSEAINNHVVRKGTCVLGGSSAIVGSGFAVRFSVLKKCLSEMDSVGGFDKELEIKLLQTGIKTIYLEEAVVYDEKVQNREVFKNQRKRWIASQFFYLRKYRKESFRALARGQLALFNSAFLRYAQLPRFLNLGVFCVLIVAFFFLRNSLVIPFEIYLTLFLAFITSVFLSIPLRFYSVDLLKAGLDLPKTFFDMFLLLFRLKGANEKFIHTPHKDTEK